MAGVWRDAFTCVGWKVTLCDPIWQVTCRSSEMGFPCKKSYIGLYLYQCNWHVLHACNFAVGYTIIVHIFDIVLQTVHPPPSVVISQ